mgnify:FL=1
MNKSALQDIQQALNTIRSEVERVDDETKWAALELMLSTSSSVGALSKKMTKPETKTVTRTVKWSGKFGQRAKMYPTRTNGYENDKTTELFRPV